MRRVTPFTLFVMHVLGKRWRAVLLALLVVQGVLAVLGELADVTGTGKPAAMVANNLLVIAACLALFLIILLLRPLCVVKTP